VTPAEQREMEHLRRTVAAYRELHRKARIEVETTWEQVKHGDVLIAATGVAWIVRRDGDDIQLSNGGNWRKQDPERAVHAPRVLAPVPADLTDLLLASELGAACARVDGEA
jgi:hypothetical protein